MSDECVRRALPLLEKAGRMDVVQQEALGPLRLARKALASVVAVVLACSPPRAGGKAEQVRRGGRAGGRSQGRGVELPIGSISKYTPRAADAQGKTQRVCQVRMRKDTGGSACRAAPGAACTA
ncbi:hypothetical protein NDU88_007043 [Pleurodeles waltl]|uniref:Uncharacterized protein n=1 Tax=Pleurodeles waltl TaxID=8319 RepID=A0AAV7RQI4_PLEWA|nr:hypothetical protein NDU88_007043 [Pleurodeles waltl]